MIYENNGGHGIKNIYRNNENNCGFRIENVYRSDYMSDAIGYEKD